MMSADADNLARPARLPVRLNDRSSCAIVRPTACLLGLYKIRQQVAYGLILTEICERAIQTRVGPVYPVCPVNPSGDYDTPSATCIIARGSPSLHDVSQSPNDPLPALSRIT